MPMSPAAHRSRIPSQRTSKRRNRAAPGSIPGDNRPESIGYLVRNAYRSFVRALSSELAPDGILSGQWSVLRALWEEEGLSQVELADRMKVEKASLTGVLDSMEKSGLIERLRNTQDRRKINIRLSARGRSLKTSLLPHGTKINKRATRGMSAKDIEDLRRLLAKLVDNLEI